MNSKWEQLRLVLIKEGRADVLELMDRIEQGSENAIPFKRGDRVIIKLQRPYSETELQNGCDLDVDGKTGVVECVVQKFEDVYLYNIKLDEPLSVVDDYENDNYWEYHRNVKLISK